MSKFVSQLTFILRNMYMKKTIFNGEVIYYAGKI